MIITITAEKYTGDPMRAEWIEFVGTWGGVDHDFPSWRWSPTWGPRVLHVEGPDSPVVLLKRSTGLLR